MIGVGQTIGNYTITAKVGEGGMGVVYRAEHPVIGRTVAIKAIHPELSRNPEVVSRFITEAKSVNQIGNEHIVDIHDFGNTSDGEFYFIMEFLPGESLAERLKREPVLDPVRALQIVAQVADALAASHSHHIIHRDLKPENVFLIQRGSTADFVKVLDFGLAKLQGGEEKVTHKTRTGSVMGTPYYMAPEQCEGKADIDHRADLYSLGVILYEMITGSVPFTGEGYGEIIVKHITQAPQSPRAVNARVTVAQEAVVMRALQKSREDRFQSMQEFRAAMLNPDLYLTTAPALAGSRWTFNAGPGESSEEVSGPTPFGGPRSRRLQATQPTTFQGAGGEMVDDEVVTLPRSRRGLIAALAIVGVGAVAAGAMLMTKKSDGGAPAAVIGPSPVPAVAPAMPPATPSHPDKVVIEVESRPDQAEVFRKETQERLGTTPVKLDFPWGDRGIDLVLKKAGHEDLPMDFVPTNSQKLLGTLVAKPVPAPVKPVATKPVARPPRPTARPVKKPATPAKVDEDSVLEPKF